MAVEPDFDGGKLWKKGPARDTIDRGPRGLIIALGRLVKLADTQDLGSCAERRRGSSPRAATLFSTSSFLQLKVVLFELFGSVISAGK